MSRPLGAYVAGFPAAWALARLAGEEVDTRRALEAAGGATNLLRARQVGEFMADLREAVGQREAWQRAQEGSASGTAEPVLAEVVSSSSVMDEISTVAAADLLGVSARRVTALLQGDLLTGRKVGRAWLVSRRSVLEHRESRRAA